MVPSEGTQALMQLVEECSAGAGAGAAGSAGKWGGSDANLTAALGIPTLDGLGPIGAGFHSDEEYLELASIAPRMSNCW